MSNVGMFEEARQASTIKKLKKRIVELMEVNKDHQTLNGKLRAELSIEKKNHDLVKEDNQLLNIEIGRMMNNLTKWKRYCIISIAYCKLMVVKYVRGVGVRGGKTVRKEQVIKQMKAGAMDTENGKTT